jgi:3-isopropylmalate/(R)-2-methylmalate dehydratase small subunit
MLLKGRVWKFGDNLRSNYFISGKYDPLGRAGKFAEMASHVLEDVDPTFVSRVTPGDILVVGHAFGTGKHLDGPINSFKHLGIAAVLGKSFSAAWERDSINLGLPSLVYESLVDEVEDGDEIELDTSATTAKNLTRGMTIYVQPTPLGILDIVDAGGIAEWTAKRLGIVNKPRTAAH